MSTPVLASMSPRPPDPAPERPPDEAALVRRAAAGEPRAAALLVEGSYRPVYAALFKLTGGDAELAADLTQETFRQAWASLRSFQGRAAFSTWLYRIAYNAWASHVRRPRRVLPIDPESPDPVADGPGPAEVALAEDEARRLRRAVVALPDDLRFTVTARFWRDLPVREIARVERITTVAVRKRLAKAFTLIRRHLEDA